VVLGQAAPRPTLTGKSRSDLFQKGDREKQGQKL
jgi:hypothetical protein